MSIKHLVTVVALATAVLYVSVTAQDTPAVQVGNRLGRICVCHLPTVCLSAEPQTGWPLEPVRLRQDVWFGEQAGGRAPQSHRLFVWRCWHCAAAATGSSYRLLTLFSLSLARARALSVSFSFSFSFISPPRVSLLGAKQTVVSKANLVKETGIVISGAQLVEPPK